MAEYVPCYIAAKQDPSLGTYTSRIRSCFNLAPRPPYSRSSPPPTLPALPQTLSTDETRLHWVGSLFKFNLDRVVDGRGRHTQPSCFPCSLLWHRGPWFTSGSPSADGGLDVLESLSLRFDHSSTLDSGRDRLDRRGLFTGSLTTSDSLLRLWSGWQGMALQTSRGSHASRPPPFESPHTEEVVGPGMRGANMLCAGLSADRLCFGDCPCPRAIFLAVSNRILAATPLALIAIALVFLAVIFGAHGLRGH
jgi:hypothetical protein